VLLRGRRLGWPVDRSARRAAGRTGIVDRLAGEEVATELHQSSGTAASRTRQASALVDRLPDTLAARTAGWRHCERCCLPLRRTDRDLRWERTDRAEALRALAGA
jgi:hypothetical protein